MPELPDVETFKRDLDAAAPKPPVAEVRVGARAGRLLHGLPPAALAGRIEGQALTGSRRYGKYLFIEVGEGWLVLHFGMSGRLRYVDDAGDLPADPELLLRFRDDAALAYLAPRKLGRIDWSADADAYVAARGLGPDALAIGLAEFRQRARKRRGSVKAWLMDQGSLAGIGNVYSDEILFQAGIHPMRAVADLDAAAVKALHTSVRRVLRQAIDARGDREAMPRSFLLPQRKPGGRCPRCGGPVAATRMGGRTAWYCPHCQPPEPA